MIDKSENLHPMTYPQALKYALDIQKKFPDYVLCGSVALILKGEIPERTVGDIDFVTTADKVDEKSLLSMTYGGYFIDNGNYRCYEIENFKHNVPFSFNLFVFDKGEDINFSTYEIRLKVQDTSKIAQYKTEYNRGKDRKDLKGIKGYRGSTVLTKYNAEECL